ncbi:hypothetical protein [Clostridium saccharobutylicum]|uniref:Uncharacterized protein n=1 Tax=Clostridium saccharobutylicum DSM 13864 TaxID=1345695 RepID=U5MZ59_CLOSA|nr:hypothetical protein [Clostridium saccharobutylicum]AGX44921.1 hypothetical protein CLSA_c39610 [Clostridium saccharobutylicum DSM 13864]AQR92202.1 hypothetical protein CLOSC_39320 [Clostridium saccharobutylicum]AQS02104.1 hypothetical protein CSACC_39370 [Clostridium saccharobutylicum]AQS11708.1 hypothetical protein CLOBY_38660 [Clostridium saccharobutylicum]AQS16087.1 hypothetical protein CLOSACC_39370 [Clostridium saccharobutylicum]
MKINILDNVFEFDNTIEDVEINLKKVDEIIDLSQLRLSYITINKVQCYDNFYENIINNLKEIETINIVLKSEEEIINEVCQSIFNYLKSGIPQLEELIDAFYLKDGAELWNRFVTFLDGLESIVEKVHFLLENFRESSAFKILGETETFLSSYIKELGKAIEIDDRVFISDLIMYEIKPILENLYNELKITFSE